jgi:hypothetical protein
MLAGAALGQWDATPVLAVMQANAATVGNTNLVGWWKLDGNATDSSGRGNAGTLFGSPSFVPDRNDVANGAISLVDSSSQYVAILNNGGLDITNRPLTIMAWMRPTATNFTGYPFCRNSATAADLQYGMLLDTTLLISFRMAGVDKAKATVSLSTSVWTHVACVWETDGTPVIYTNGVTAATGSDFTSDLTDRTNVTIGARSSAANGSTRSAFMTGYVDDVRVYRQQLTPAEIATAMGGGQP